MFIYFPFLRRLPITTKSTFVLHSNPKYCFTGFIPTKTVMANLHTKCRFPNEYVYKRIDDGKMIRYRLVLIIVFVKRVKDIIKYLYVTLEKYFFLLFRVVRTEVPLDWVPWEVPFDTYDTITFTAPHLKTATWADPDIDDQNFHPNWNTIDGKINRESHEGIYRVRHLFPV